MSNCDKMKAIIIIFETLLFILFTIKCNCEDELYYDESKEFDSNESNLLLQNDTTTEKDAAEIIEPDKRSRSKTTVQIHQDYSPTKNTIPKKNDETIAEKSSEEVVLVNSNSKEYYPSAKTKYIVVKATTEAAEVPKIRRVKDKMPTIKPEVIKVGMKKEFYSAKPNRTRGGKRVEEKVNLERKSGESENPEDTLSYYPYSVSIQKKGSHYATGALLNKRWILTTASEFFNVRESIKLFRARLGTVNCKKGGIKVPLKSIEIHPMYKHKMPAFDVSLLRTGHMVNYTEAIRPIVLSRVTAKIIKAKFLTTYWPRLIKLQVKGQVLPGSANEREKHSSMRVSIQRMVPWETCSSILDALGVKLTGVSFCLKPVESHHSRCMPDAGAPVVAEDGLWGITSGWTSDQCYTKSSPTISTRIAAPRVLAWIESHIH